MLRSEMWMAQTQSYYQRNYLCLFQTSTGCGWSYKMKSRNDDGANHRGGAAQKNYKVGTAFGVSLTFDQLRRINGLKECSVVLERID